jgi:hypothetical protein
MFLIFDFTLPNNLILLLYFNSTLSALPISALQMNRKGSNNIEKKTIASSRRKEEFLKSINRVRHSYDSKEQCWSKVTVPLSNCFTFK